MRIYIAGRMTGIPEHNYPAFAHAAAAWRNAGWTVLNPAEHFGGDQTRSYYEYIEADIVDLKTCDAIAMLPGWDDEEARGSVWEYLIAKHLLKIPVFNAMKPFTPFGFNGLDELVEELDKQALEDLVDAHIARRPNALCADYIEGYDG